MKTKTVKKVGKVKKALPMKKAPMQAPSPQMAPQQPQAGAPVGPPQYKKGGVMKKKGKC